MGSVRAKTHHVAGSAVKLAEDKGVPLDGLSLEDLQSLHPAFEVLEVLKVGERTGGVDTASELLRREEEGGGRRAQREGEERAERRKEER